MDQSHRQRVDDLVRQVPQDRAEQPATAHQHLPGVLGTKEVQTAQVIQEGPQVVGRADRKAATPIHSLDLDDRLPEQLLDGTSGVMGDFHTPFCGSPG